MVKFQPRTCSACKVINGLGQGFLATLLSSADKGDWWRAHNSRFRQQFLALEEAEGWQARQGPLYKYISGCWLNCQGSTRRPGVPVQEDGKPSLKG